MVDIVGAGCKAVLSPRKLAAPATFPCEQGTVGHLIRAFQTGYLG